MIKNKLSRDKILRAKTAILMRSPEESLADTIYRDRDAFSGFRLLMASDAAGEPIQQMLAESGNFAAVFCGKRVLAFSDELEAKMQKGPTDLMFGIRAILDTNVLSELPSLFRGQKIDKQTRLIEILQDIDQNFDRKVDWSFASLENLREAAKPNNPWPYLKVAAVRKFEADKQWRSGVKSFDEFIPAAEEQWRAWLGSEEIWHQIHRRDVVYAVLLFAMLECWRKRSIQQTMRGLLRFCLESFKTIPMKEIYFGWKAIRGIHDSAEQLSVFNESALKAPKKNSLDRISALAWDLFLFRYCETLMTQMKGNEFFVPAVTTLDAKLLATINACPLRAILMHEDAEYVETIFDDELAFHQCFEASMDDSIRKTYNDPARQAMAGTISSHRLREVIFHLESEVLKMVASNAGSMS